MCSQTYDQHRVPEQEVNIKMGKWAKLLRMSEAVSRSRRRPDLMVRAA